MPRETRNHLVAGLGVMLLGLAIGSGGTVLKISMALSNLEPGDVESSLPETVRAIDSTLTFSAVGMFIAAIGFVSMLITCVRWFVRPAPAISRETADI